MLGGKDLTEKKESPGFTKLSLQLNSESRTLRYKSMAFTSVLKIYSSS